VLKLYFFSVFSIYGLRKVAWFPRQKKKTRQSFCEKTKFLVIYERDSSPFIREEVKNILFINLEFNSKLSENFSLTSYLFVLFSNMIHNKHEHEHEHVDKVEYIGGKETNI
jgi:hypothetical protein